jgi:hypothetical protein
MPFAGEANNDARSTRRRGKFALFAASIAVAAATGTLAGALGASGLMQPIAANEKVALTAAAGESRALHDEIAQMRAEIAAIHTSLDGITRTSSAQFAKIGERIDRAEHAQAEPAARLAKAIEALERLQRRAEPAKDITGSVPSSQPAVLAPPHPQQAPQPGPSQPAILQGWTLHDVYRGIAVIRGGRYGTIEVEAGDMVPGLGRIEAIRRQDGRWVVITSKGRIVAAR